MDSRVWKAIVHRIKKRQVSKSRSVVSNSLRPHGLFSPWNSPDKNTGVGSRSLLQVSSIAGPTMWETCVQSLGWEELLEKEMATHSRILA